MLHHVGTTKTVDQQLGGRGPYVVKHSGGHRIVVHLLKTASLVNNILRK
jgi:hypothetical protein